MSHMSKVAVRELRNDTAGVLARVAAGEVVVVTVRGRSVAQVTRLRNQRMWLPRAQFVGRILGLQPDRRLTADVRAVAPE